MAKWDHDRHRANCDALRDATRVETADAQSQNDFRQEVYDEARFFHMVLVQLAGTTGTWAWSTAIADAHKQLKEERERARAEGLTGTVNSESPDSQADPKAAE